MTGRRSCLATLVLLFACNCAFANGTFLHGAGTGRIDYLFGASHPMSEAAYSRFTRWLESTFIVPWMNKSDDMFNAGFTPAVAQERLAADERPVATASDAALPNNPVEPTMQGLVTLRADGATFRECAGGPVYMISAEGDFAALEHAYLAAGQEPGFPILATFDGMVVSRDEEDGIKGNKNSVRVDRFVGVWPEVSCDQVLSDVSLTNTYWKILSLEGQKISATEVSKDPHLVLMSNETRFTASVGCNQLMGTYNVSSAHRISFSDSVSSTMVACREPLDAYEAMLAAVIDDTVAFRIDGSQLTLLDAEAVPIAQFQAVSLK
jgi:heat shock protein HslJ